MFAAHNFQYRVDVFFTQILMGSDFDEKIKEYVPFLDQTIHLFFPDQIADKDLYDMRLFYTCLLIFRNQNRKLQKLYEKHAVKQDQ